jgi:hypothetical protein
MAALFTDADLALWLQVPSVDSQTAASVRRAASGWLMRATGVTPWPPDPTIPDDIWAWAVELAAIAFRNPDGAGSESIDDHSVSWDRQRRLDILREARTAYSTGGAPLGDFPAWDWSWVAVPTTSSITA